MSNAIISLPEFTKCCDKKKSKVKEHGGCNGNQCIILDPR